MADFVVEHQPQQQQKQQQKILVLQRDGTVTELNPAPSAPATPTSAVRQESEPEHILPDDEREMRMEDVVIEETPHLEVECVEEEVTLSPHGTCHEFIVENADNMGQEVVIGDVEEVVGAEEVVDASEDLSGHANGLSSSEAEMSVALDLAKMSQGHFTDNHTLNGHQFYEAAEEVVVADEGQTVTLHHQEVTGEDESQTAIREFLPNHDEISFQKPRLSYAQMIAESLIQAPDRMLPLSEIYVYISKRYPFYRMDVKSWQNAIRHNLTLNTGFTKVPRPNNEGRGNYWRIEDGAEKNIFKRTIRNHYQNTKPKDTAIYTSPAQAGLPPMRQIRVQGSDFSSDETNRAIRTIQIIQAPKGGGPVDLKGGNFQTIKLNKSMTSTKGQVIFIALPSKS
ncbi:hypothetical protein TCAL_08957 [Tigriopus californicus]|uniref:Fork-head domain-containing protein n=1 Tax=Tigriopus californicus TaxID=6832 RepID=A0A553PR32_TIGCA|nr:uncharacterized protein LOC131881580 [Tigriopus californicus]TRY80131.1 hypothetical protein TCAL_08957 [Tigriopus californicus]|eukprot:TCALIF_08957-PA protein Name:"Similar to FOXK2 Forkhead box protein K2 (Homo sapiens)" AED:0.00 eAED:0.00 QI:281/1/1/1/1/1/2/617/395